MKALRTPNARFGNLSEYESSPKCMEINGQQINYMDTGTA